MYSPVNSSPVNMPAANGWGCEVASGSGSKYVVIIATDVNAEKLAELAAAHREFITDLGVSIVGGIVTSISLGWVLTTPGVVSYAAWNVLVLVLSILVVVSLRRRQKDIALAGVTSAGSA